MISFEDLEHELQDILIDLGKHPKITVATGAKEVILYVVGRQTANLVESKIPAEYRGQVQIVLTGKPRPARHEPTPKAAKNRGPSRKRGGGRGRRPPKSP